MRIFWALVAILGLAAGGAVFLRGGDSRDSRQSAARTDARRADERAVVTTPAGASTTSARTEDSDPERASSPGDADRESSPGVPAVPVETGVSDVEPGTPTVLPDARDDDTSDPAAAESSSSGEQDTDAAAQVPDDQADATTDSSEVSDGGAEGTATVASHEEHEVVSDGVVRLPDGKLLLDDRFELEGAGTEDDPYLLTWDMLVAASETYKPRLGKRDIPPFFEALDGKHTKITGYIAFPVAAESPDEMLMMLNQWDGCCIGIPPTPYDAVEVSLAHAVKGSDRFATYGSVEAVFRVDPYLVRDWLVSLYIMEDAKLVTSE